MSEGVARKFIDALGKLEAERDVETIASVFAETAEVGNIISPEKFQGQAGAREFWTKYRDTFGRVRSEFRNIIATDNHAALEWTTDGTSTNGAPVKYDGVSILEIEGDKVSRFRAYFNAGELGQQIVDEATGNSNS